MKDSKNRFFKMMSSAIIIFALVCTTGLSAQPSGATDTQDVIPLDGGLIALVIGAAAYGVSKLRNKKQ